MTSRARIFTIVLLLLLTANSYAWQPDGQPQLGFSRVCHPQLWAHKYLDTRAADARLDLLKTYLRDCAPQSHDSNISTEVAELKMSSLEDRAREWELISFVDSFGFVQSGRLLMQKRQGPRPLIVVACDFNCDPTENPWLKTIVMQLYDEGGAHIYIADSPESRAPSQFVFVSGGFQYGRDLMEAGRWLQLFSSYRGKFRSAHLLGAGWAAHSVLYGELFNDKNPIADDRKVFHSSVAYCPSVSLDSTLNEMDQPRTSQSNNESLKLRNVISSLRDSHLSWSEWFEGWSTNESLKTRWIRASLAQSQQQDFHWIAPYRLEPPSNADDWLEATNFIYESQGVKTPAWVLGASKDPRYPANEHWRPLGEQHRDPRKSNLRVVEIDDNTTCSLPATYGWAFSSSLLRTIVLQEAFEIWPRYNQRRVAWNVSGTPKLQTGESHVDQVWNLDESGGISVTFYIDGSAGRRKVKVDVPSNLIEDLVRIDKSDRSTAKRQLNAWLRLRGANEPLVFSSEKPQYLEIRD